MKSPTVVRLPPAFQDLNVGIRLHDPENGGILDVNNRITELYGYSADELRSMTIEDYTAPSTKFSQAEAISLIKRAAGGDPQTFEWQIERANNELRWVRVHLNATTIDGTRCVLAEIEDITEYWARERRLRLLSRIVRHNLRNKTTVLMGYADQIKQAVEDDTLEEAVETILDITSEVGTLSDSVQQIEEIATPDATERCPTNLRPIIESIAEEMNAEYPAIDLSIEMSEDVWVIADKGVNYAIEHALQNAIKHNERDTPQVSICLADDHQAHRGVVRIADNGPPIPDMEIDALSMDTTNTTYHGTGVGLWVMQWCVDSLGGELTFEENSPRGNVVAISLPKPGAPNDET